MKIAISGATGFIGRHVVAELERQSLSPVLICRPSAKIPFSLSRHTIIPIDLTSNPSGAFDLLGRPDALIHLAWGGLPHYKSPHHLEVELPMHIRFLKDLIESGLKHLTVAGTCLEYGMQSGPLNEDAPTRPSNPYALAKNELRGQLQSLKAYQPFNLVWARLFYMYGEGQSESSLRPQLQKAVARGLPTFDMSGGEQLRDYLPVSEVATQLVSLTRKGVDTGAINVCSGVPISVRRLVEGWISDNNWKIKLNLGHYPYPEYEPMAFWGENRKFTDLIKSHCAQTKS